MTTASLGTLDVPALLAKLGASPRRITADSRRVEAGVAFAAYPGGHFDGRAFVADAIARGASAVLWELRSFQWDARWSVPNLPVDDLRAQLGVLMLFDEIGEGLVHERLNLAAFVLRKRAHCR